MSEEIKVKAVEDENPSIAEKETKVLKKMGANIGEETITKVDLRKPKEEINTNEEQKTEQAPIVKENIQEPVKEKEEEPIIEEIKEETPAEEKAPVKKTKTEESVKEKPIKQKKEPELNIPEGILELVNFMNETGGSLEDYIKLSKDYNSLEEKDLIKEYYNITKPHLNSEEVDFLVDDNFSYEEDVEEPKDIKRKQLAYKEELAKAKNYLTGQKEKYYSEIKTSGNLSVQQQRAVDFFNKYNEEQSNIKQSQKTAYEKFELKTNEVFNNEFKGFDFNVDNKKFRFKSKNAKTDKNVQMDVMNIFGSYLDTDNSLKDGYGYHKALFAARNADNIANHFYQLGKTDAIKEVSSESKNINMDPRQTSTGYVESGGIKVRAISGNDSSKLRIKLRDKK